MNKKFKKVFGTFLVSSLVLGILFSNSIIRAEEESLLGEEIEVTNEVEKDEEVNAKEKDTIEIEETGAEDAEEEAHLSGEILMTSEVLLNSAPANWAFTDESKFLNDAIVLEYGTIIDIDNDGYISISEANAYTGGINLNEKEIEGTLNGIENFIQITNLFLNGNKFSGKIPTNIGNLASVSNLQLGNNNLTGEIPLSIKQLSSATVIYLHGNKLTGNLPSDWSGMNNLKDITIFNNPDLTGTIPSSLVNLPSLKSVRYHFTSIGESDLNNVPFTGFCITKATNVNLTNANTVYIGGSKTSGMITRMMGSAGAFDWDSATGYYIVKSGTGVKYTLYSEIDEGNALSSQIDLSEGGLVDQEGNLVHGATLANVNPDTGAIVLLGGGTIVTGEGTFHFDSDVSMLNGVITTSGKYISEKQTIEYDTNGNASIGLATVETTVTVADGETATITIGNVGSSSTLPKGTIVETLNGDKTYVLDGASMTTDGTLTEDKVMISVPVDKVNDVTVDRDEITFPAGSEVTKNGETAVYPDTIIVDTNDNSITYLPVDSLFNEDKTNLANNVNQDSIDEAQSVIDQMTDSQLKNELQDKIELAQDMLDAKDAVDDLFNEKKDNLAENVTQENIDDAQDLVNKLPEGELKEELQKEIDKAQDLVNKLPNGELKDQLQSIIDEAQKQLDAQNTSNPIVKPSTPSTTPTVSKPSVGTTSTTGGSTVNTGDTTNIQLYIGLLAATMTLLGLVTYKRKLTK